MNQEVYVGKIIWFDNKKSYGFISWEINGVAQKDIFLHFSDILCEGFKTVKKDQKVSFTIGVNNRNQPKACNVTVIND